MRVVADHARLRFGPLIAVDEALSLSMYSVEKPSSFMEPMSPPDPFTHSTSTVSPVSVSLIGSFEDVLPPPKFVMRLSEPRRFDL